MTEALNQVQGSGLLPGTGNVAMVHEQISAIFAAAPLAVQPCQLPGTGLPLDMAALHADGAAGQQQEQASAGMAEGGGDAVHQLQQLAMHGMLDPAALAAMAAGLPPGLQASEDASGGASGADTGLTLPVVHTVEVPAPLEEEDQQTE